MLRIPGHIADAMIAHALTDHPEEACGVLTGLIGTGEVTGHIPMENELASTTRFAFDPDQQLRVWLGMDARGEEPVAIYHSHTRGAAYPSSYDVQAAFDPDLHYVIAATDPVPVMIRSYRIVDGVVSEEPVEICEGSQGISGVQMGRSRPQNPQ